MLWGIAPNASTLAADTEKTNKPMEKKQPPETDEEMAELLKMMELLQEMEMLQDYHIVAEGKSDEKEN